MITQQSEFATALFNPQSAIPDNVTSHTTRQPVKRFAVYRNNVVVGLINTLKAKFPATERIVGEEFFAAMARIFVATYPPRSKILHTYGDDFADFIVAFEPAAELPYLADVARLEAARTRAYHAADAEPLTAAAFQDTDADRVGSMRFTLHPSLQIVCSHHPVVTIWSMNAGEWPLGPIDDMQAEDALVIRPGLDVLVRTLPPGGAAFLYALARGSRLDEAAAHATDRDNRFDLTANIAGLIASGAVTHFALAEDRTS
ncbi:DNA-binding domain-containing protein [Pseudorhodoplanes sinuspersici]|uniref:DUF2063 domain-containing protein n=1 Tax=Pseudorhodoplanes sinuspersici TaxID=1235591 RepID=A0A1W6ZU43_9HYPH|nr:DNA-binding domain-containing protein [Pseudorhodoplanes sinuspersici]ARQ00852.1 DUF2063 domain-containing protein [Pseudorhodoplanes sinuspersici]RKE72471.1 putative DNA-binding protein [Pseudorhodoplanes sinuspersici]